MGLDLGIRSGRPALKMASDLKQYLLHPDKLFRRVRDEHGQLHLSKAAAAYHPGRGVYRSSYKNARRLAATETNIAYRTADYTRWQQLDFVVGIEVRLSNNHTCLGGDGKPHAFSDICDDLKGRYPKDFKFTGWHPHCRCHAVTILKTPEEMAADNKRIMEGKESEEASENAVTDVPEGFSQWIKRNEKRIAQAGSLPYFIKDNRALLPISDVEGTRKLGRREKNESYRALINHKEKHDYTPEQIENFKEIERVTGYKRGVPMTFAEANHGQSNIYKDRENCSACVLVHELRLRGFNITATRFQHTIGSLSEQLSKDTNIAWITKKGTKPEFTEIGGTEKDIVSKLEKRTTPVGSRYHLGWDVNQWFGHIITAERTELGLVLYDPQRDCFMSVGEILHEMLDGSKIQVLRVDRLMVKPSLLDSLTTSLE